MPQKKAAAPAPPAPKVWQPGADSLKDGEELCFDPTAYDCLHAFRLPWPCLSFDIVGDDYGNDRKQFPHTLFCLAGTQALNPQDNSVSLMRLANLTRMKHKKVSADSDSDDESSSEEDEDEDEDGMGGPAGAVKPSMQAQSVAHHGGVNRIRCMPQKPQMCATWGDTGRVQLWDLTPQWRQLTEGGAAPSAAGAGVARVAPAHIFGGHREEGFAVDWSPVVAGRLATGDCAGCIYKWEPPAAGTTKWAVDTTPFRGHEGSVEDIQWSPTEAEVFASCGVDGHICIWDARAEGGARGTAALRVKAHDADVNVISWNRLASCMVASGCDDGSFRIWDLRSFKEDGFIANFKYHTQPITSIEWSPHESSVLVTTCADNQTSVWDLALERDAEEEAEFESQQQKPQAKVPDDLPPQLLFQHMGQRDVKEAHWHAQIPGMIVTTSADGFNAFRPSNM